jgi:hypothetical protein
LVLLGELLLWLLGGVVGWLEHIWGYFGGVGLIIEEIIDFLFQ